MTHPNITAATSPWRRRHHLVMPRGLLPIMTLWLFSSMGSASSNAVAAASMEEQSPTTFTAEQVVKEEFGANADFGILDWINNAIEGGGGYVNPSVEYRTVQGDSDYNELFCDDINNDNENESSSCWQRQDPRRLVATQPIAKGDILLRIPWSLVFAPNSTENEQRQTLRGESLHCFMVRALAQELQKGATSTYAPLMQFLQDSIGNDHHGHSPILPSAWSLHGQYLLQTIVGDRRSDQGIPPLEPTEWISYDWIQDCQGSPNDGPIALLVVQWGLGSGSNSAIVPVLAGMLHHRNGAVGTNAEITVVRPNEPVTLHATRAIAGGETIAISRNLCRHCGTRHREYGTAELLRDYGFIENYPQGWHYRDIQFEVDFRDENTGDVEERLWELKWKINWNPPKPEEFQEMVVWLKREIRRLQRLRNLHYHLMGHKNRDGIPPKEWATAWEFQLANVRALTLAAKALEVAAPSTGTISKTPLVVVAHTTFAVKESEIQLEEPHYHLLGWEFDDIDYRDETCDNDEALNFPYHRQVEEFATPYQNMQFSVEPETKDVVLQLDAVIQIASCYRPHYHEYSVHAAARYLESVKRVIFIGGGDSMLLHEVLKYPELELVVGLELDQTVTRKSFRYFHTQPHFDDPRVEWWFGDATKSLLLLTKDYWQSFDLVLVDLSETVMSLSVTAELDVFDALALLLKPEGILVKNEQYLEAVSQVFDYSVQIVYESPVICDQVLTMGSNKVDFLHSPVKDHGIETLLYKPLVAPTNRLDLWHDYRVNDARAQGKCDAPRECDTPASEQSRSAGIMEILDVEQTSITLDDSLIASLEAVVATEGFELTTSPVRVGENLLMVMKEGYILARFWSSKQYCSMDINLWGGFDKLRSLRSELTLVLKSPVVSSSYKVVVGGMFGSSTWNEDRSMIGPQIVQARNCEDKQFFDLPPNNGLVLPSTKDLVVAAVEDSISYLVHTNGTIAVAICGLEGEECFAWDLLEKTKNVGRVIRLFACPNLDASESSSMYRCEVSLASVWRKALGKNEKTQLLLVDQTAPKPMLQILDSLLSQGNFLDSVIANTNVFLAWSSAPQEESWRKYFLENYRRHYLHDPIFRGELLIRAGTQTVEFGVVSCAGDNAIYALQQVEASLRERFPLQHGNTIDISLQKIAGGKYMWLDDWEPKKFFQSDYDNQPGLDQYFQQRPLAHHVVFQMEAREGEPPFEFSVDTLTSALENALKSVKFDCPHQSLYQGLGDGCLVVCLNPSLGSVLLAWDGRTHVDVSYYRVGKDTMSFSEMFSRSFQLLTRAKLRVTLQDAMPRGTGRTVNPASDLKTPAELEVFFLSLGKRSQRIAQ